MAFFLKYFVRPIKVLAPLWVINVIREAQLSSKPAEEHQGEEHKAGH